MISPSFSHADESRNAGSSMGGVSQAKRGAQGPVPMFPATSIRRPGAETPLG
ncbi:Uncharacterised protein [Mycobacteroides abscessus subsp. abscessus]|nr:Uncharacterised protein [Mycobacteroides abscessus subsp. abscessus]